MLVNPTKTDFNNNQERGLDYQQYRSSSDILRAVAEFYKVTFFQKDIPGNLNFITLGFEPSASLEGSKIVFGLTKGLAVLDNQPIVFFDDIRFEYDKPTHDQNYYIYLFYKYVEEYPPNVAFAKITTEPIDLPGYYLLAKAFYNYSDNLITLDTSPRDQLIDASSMDKLGIMIPSYKATDFTAKTGHIYFVDTTAGPITVTLTDDPSIEGRIEFYDVAKNFGTNPLIIKAPSGWTIEGEASISINTSGAYVVLQTRGDMSKIWYKILDTSPMLKPFQITKSEIYDLYVYHANGGETTINVEHQKDYITVIVNGIVLTPNDDYTDNNDNYITLKESLNNGDTVLVYVWKEAVTDLGSNGCGGGEFTEPDVDLDNIDTGGGSITPVYVSSNTVADVNRLYIIDTSSSDIDITLPSNPENGDTIWFADGRNNAQNHPPKIIRNGKKINGKTEDLICDVNAFFIALTFNNSADSWFVINAEPTTH